jgi:hypothetical protein
MMLDREETVGNANKGAPSFTRHLSDELTLVFDAAGVLQYGIRSRNIETLFSERQRSAGDDLTVADLGECGLKFFCLA